MIRKFATVAVTALALSGASLTPAIAQASEAQTEALIAAIAAAGCEVREDNNTAVLTEAGVSEEEAAEIVAALLGDGRAAIEGGSLRLKTAGCN